ncbi:MAG: ribonuclease R [Spongiibacteraceae bacterium]
MPKRTPPQDPHAAREAENYERPIASREYILEVLEREGPLNHSRLCEKLKLDDPEQVEALRRRLRAMERDGQVMRNRKDAYCAVSKLDLIRGRVQGHRDGYGFVIPEKGEGEESKKGDDLYLSSRQMAMVFDGDQVLVRESGVDGRGRREATIVEVLQRNTQQLVGRYYERGDRGSVTPENPRINQSIAIAREDSLDARDGQYVMIAITQQPDFRAPARGRVVEVLGEHMAPGMEIEVAIRSYGIPFVWPEAVTTEAQSFAPEPNEDDKKHRVDLRNLPLVTIDGEDARDFDDAVYCEKKKGGGWKLWVAIADVSHYVKVSSALDREAQVRGNSVYFPDRVVPMLPEALSNGLCSLKPLVDRLCMVCEMTISADGKLTGYRFCEAVMHSKARLTYNIVWAMLDEENLDHFKWRSHYKELVPHVEELYRLYKSLRAARDERGAIDFETVETKVMFTRDRKIDRIVPVVRNDAHKIIEECMLAANVATAELLEKLKLPALYRVHEGPPDQRLLSLRQFLGELGLNLGGGDKPTPIDYQYLLEQVHDRADLGVIQTVMLRSLSQARYQAENEGHFGLNYPAYTHFTSPIRRYPDLLIHRAIRFLLRGGGEGKGLVGKLRGTRKGLLPVEGAPVLSKEQIYPYDFKQLSALGEQCSMTERRADEATRDVMAWLKCEYLQDRVGEQFEGLVTAVTNFGLFVELSDLYVEGLVHISALESDYYHFDAVKHRLIGEKSGRFYQLGDKVTVQVVRVNLDDRKVDLELIAGVTRAQRRAQKAGGAAVALSPASDKKSRKSSSVSSGSKRGAIKTDKAGTNKTRADKTSTDKKPVDGKKKADVNSRLDAKKMVANIKAGVKKVAGAKKAVAEKANVEKSAKPAATSVLSEREKIARMSGSELRQKTKAPSKRPRRK